MWLLALQYISIQYVSIYVCDDMLYLVPVACYICIAGYDDDNHSVTVRLYTSKEKLE